MYSLLVPKQSSKKCKDNPVNYRFPSERGIPYDNFTIETKDHVKLEAWFLRKPIPDQVPTVVYFHESAGSIFVV